MPLTATAAEMQNHFSEFLSLVMSGQQIIVTENGQEVGRFIPKDTAVSWLTDSLIGILPENGGVKSEKSAYLREKYAIAD